MPQFSIAFPFTYYVYNDANCCRAYGTQSIVLEIGKGNVLLMKHNHNTVDEGFALG